MKRKETHEKETYKRKYIRCYLSEYDMDFHGIRLSAFRCKTHKLVQVWAKDNQALPIYNK